MFGIQTYGAFISSEETLRIPIASPWMEGGSLVDYLHECCGAPQALLVNVIILFIFSLPS
jgi:hypothetical protein